MLPVVLPRPPQQASALTATVVLAPTALVVTGKSAVVDPARTTTSAGTWTTPGFALVSVTRAPPFAGPLNVARPVAGPPPPMLEEERTSDTMIGPVGGGSDTCKMVAHERFPICACAVARAPGCSPPHSAARGATGCAFTELFP
jgi:hypothetical protein